MSIVLKNVILGRDVRRWGNRRARATEQDVARGLFAREEEAGYMCSTNVVLGRHGVGVLDRY